MTPHIEKMPHTNTRVRAHHETTEEIMETKKNKKTRNARKTTNLQTEEMTQTQTRARTHRETIRGIMETTKTRQTWKTMETMNPHIEELTSCFSACQYDI